MDQHASDAQERQIRVRTLHEVVDGLIRVSPLLRTLDDLNVVSRHFLTLHNPVVSSDEWAAEDGPLAVNRDSILFVMELVVAPPVERTPDADRFSRASIRLRVGDYLVEGYLHVPPGGSPLKRLHQDSRPFLALTRASVSRQGANFEAPFLAINRTHILAAQELQPAEPAAQHGVG